MFGAASLGMHHPLIDPGRSRVRASSQVGQRPAQSTPSAGLALFEAPGAQRRWHGHPL